MRRGHIFLGNDFSEKFRKWMDKIDIKAFFHQYRGTIMLIVGFVMGAGSVLELYIKKLL